MQGQNMQDKWFAIHNAHQWAKGILIEGNLLIAILKETHATHNNMGKGINFLKTKTILDELRTKSFINEHFFVISINKFISWLKRVDDPNSTQIITEFEGLFPFHKDIRNMREHDVEYFDGSGNKQNRFVVKDKTHSFVCDGSSTIIIGESYLIGGRIDVIKVLHFIETKIDIIKSIENKYMEQLSNQKPRRKPPSINHTKIFDVTGKT